MSENRVLFRRTTWQRRNELADWLYRERGGAPYTITQITDVSGIYDDCVNGRYDTCRRGVGRGGSVTLKLRTPPKVYSKRKGAEKPPADAVYVGRPTPFGNPFVVGRDGDHERCVELYREWLGAPEQKDLRAKMVRELHGTDLVCWCAPKPCHADVIAAVANA